MCHYGKYAQDGGGKSVIDGDDGLRVDILGAFRLVVDGQEVAVKRPQVRRLLALLAARSPQSVSTDQLIEHLWGDKPPADPRAALRVVLSRTRSDLGDHSDSLESTSSGQRLRISTDAAEFDRLRNQATDLAADGDDPSAGIALAEQALKLWRGAPFADIDAPELEPVSQRLVDARWQLGIRLAHLYHHAGNDAALIELARPMFEEHPYREEAAMLVAFALARTGQTAEGLAILQQCRDSLRNEFGLGVSEQLVELEDQLLQGGVDLPRLLDSASGPAKVAVVVDRDDVLRHVMETTDRPVVIRAEAGGGKSTLLRLVADELTGSGTQVLMATAKANPSRPLEAVAGLVEHAVEMVVERTGASLPADMQDAVSRVLPDRFDAPDVATPLTRTAMVDSIVSLVTSAYEPAPTIIVDDCQWLDRLSAEVIERMGESGTRLILGTRPELPAFLEFLGAHPTEDTAFGGAEQVELAPLTHAGAVQLFTEMAGREPTEELVGDLLRRSGGNPLFLELLIDLWCEGEMTDGDLPVSILVTVQQRLGTLSTRARDTVQVAAVFGEDVPLGLLRQLAPTADTDIDEAVRAGLVEPSGSDGFRFRHALLARGAYQLLSAGQRVVLHDEIGRLLEDAGADAAQFSPHCEQAQSIDPDRAVRAATMAAAEYALVFDWHRVLEQVEVATERPGVRVGTRDVVLLDLARGRALRALVEDGSDDALFAAARLAETLDEKELFVEAVTELCTFGRTVAFGGLNDELLGLLDEAENLDVATASQALLFASGANFLSFSDQHERSRQMFHRALELAEAADDLEVSGFVLMHAHMGLGHPHDRELLEEAAARLREIANGDADYVWEAAFLEFGLAAEDGDRAALSQLIAELRSLTPLVRRRNRDFGMAFTESSYALLGGDLDGAERYLGEAGEIGTRLYGPAWSSDLQLVILVAIFHARGQTAALFGPAQAALADRPDFPTLQAVLAATAAAADDREEARTMLDRVSVNGFDGLIPDFSWKGVAVLLADAVAYLGDAEAAESLHGLLVPFAGSMAWAGVVSYGAVDTALAKLAATMGDTVRAERYQESGEELVASLALPSGELVESA